ncbi:MAG TPA: hypothetical protein VL860_13330 [Planctomycetota bacterium]|nr:hypothetical protein [Planctomycetota bacterium]
MIPVHSDPFDAGAWRGKLAFRLKNDTGAVRERSLVDFPFTISDAPRDLDDRQMRMVTVIAGNPVEIPAQFYNLKRTGGMLEGRAAFFCSMQAREVATVQLYYGNPGAVRPANRRNLTVRKGDLGPLHFFIENDYYKIETMPKSGQIWHMWNKLGSNTSWHHNEWDTNKDKGGDPCHWAPNCWIAYPERVTNGYEAADPDMFDWHYVFGWDNPQTEFIDGPVFFEMRRKDFVWPHPEHSNPNIRRDHREKIVAEVVYRFYEGCPWIQQSSDMQTLEDMLVYFIRNSQFVFLDHVFTHAIICPDKGEVKPTDAVEPAVIRLMARKNLKPFDGVQHTLSNVLPSKLNYTSFYNNENGDGFAQIQVAERNSTVHGAPPTYFNHMIFLTELHNWAIYFCRAFSYTNRRFHPENAVFLPKGQRYQEENVCLIYKYASLDATMENIGRLSDDLRSPLKVEPLPG